jgi:hypothetical protein
MKFMAILEGQWKDMEAVSKKYLQRIETGDAIEDLFGPIQIIGEPKVITFFEMDDPDEMIKMIIDYAPELTVTVYPIEMSEKFLKIWQERKK